MNLAVLLLTCFALAYVADVTFTAVSCPNGDTAGVIKDGKTCSELVAADNAECYDTSFETSCCASCNLAARTNQNCLYGDKNTCFAFLCPSYTDINTCCETCASFITTESAAQTTSTSTASTSTASASTASTISQAVSTPGNKDGQSANTNESSNNDGLIAGAVVGSIVGLTLLVVGAFIAFKILKKNNQIEDGISSGIPEKLDGNSDYITEKVDICTVLQEELDTSSGLTGKQHPAENGETEAKTDANEYSKDLSETINSNNNVNKFNAKCNNNLDQSQINDKKLTAGSLGHTDVKDTVHDGNDVEIRRPSLAPLKESDVESKPIHGVLPPIGASTNNAHVEVLSNKTDTIGHEQVNAKHDKVLVKSDNLTNLTKGSELDDHFDQKNVSRQSNFIFHDFV